MLIIMMAHSRRLDLLISEAGAEAGVFIEGAGVFFLLMDFFFFGRVFWRALEASGFLFYKSSLSMEVYG